MIIVKAEGRQAVTSKVEAEPEKGDRPVAEPKNKKSGVSLQLAPRRRMTSDWMQLFLSYLAKLAGQSYRQSRRDCIFR